jgi:hypothetical protein
MKVVAIVFLLLVESALTQPSYSQWVRLYNPHGAPTVIRFLELTGPPRIGFAGFGVLPSEKHGIVKTTDGGKSWKDVTPPNYYGYGSAFAFIVSMTGWFTSFSGTAPCFYKTTSQGDSWYPVISPAFTSLGHYDVYYHPWSNLLFVSGTNYYNGSYDNHFSSDGGLTWPLMAASQ